MPKEKRVDGGKGSLGSAHSRWGEEVEKGKEGIRQPGRNAGSRLGRKSKRDLQGGLNAQIRKGEEVNKKKEDINNEKKVGSIPKTKR